MNSAFKPLIVVFAMVVVMVGLGYWSKSGGGHGDEDYGGMQWRKTLAEAQRESAERGRPVMAYFTASWCPPCQQMKARTWPDARVQEAMKDFVPVRIDVDEFPDVARQFGVNSIPRLQFIGPDGRPGAAVTRFLSPDELIRWLHGV